MLKKEILIYVFLVFSLVSCQEPSPNPSNNASKNKINQNTDSISLSLFQQTVFCIYQDRQENFWFGTKESGVYRYNGHQMTHYTQKEGLISNDVRRIQEDDKGFIYFDTDAGISRFDGTSFYTLPVQNFELSPSKWELNPNDLWFRMGFTNNGVYRYDGTYLHFLPFPISPQEALLSNSSSPNFAPYGLYTIYKDLQGYLWFGTASVGLLRYDGTDWGWYYENQLQTTPAGGDFGTRAIVEDGEGKIWINNTRYQYAHPKVENGLLKLDKIEGVGLENSEGGLTFPFFLSAVKDQNGHIWMATYDQGVYKFNGKILVHYPVKSEGKKVKLNSIYKDQHNKIWVGTFDHGVYRFNGCHFVTP